MSLIEPRFIRLWRHPVLQIEGSEPGSETAKKLSVKTGLKNQISREELRYLGQTDSGEKAKVNKSTEIIQHYLPIRK